MSDDKVHVIHGGDEGLTEDAISFADMTQMMEGLQKLREPFPDDKIEKLPKPKWKGAWTDKRGAHCDECHGYHVLDDCIHLDYVGHAQVTNRLLEADPFWSWEPMAYTEAGTPLFCDGGLWIRLTVCGVERIGYGDGSSVKEVIGDAIRNAAMRFGVALTLWAKIDLHSERNPGDGEAPQRRPVRDRDVRRGRGETHHDGDMAGDSGQARRASRENQHAPEETRAPNQDALDALGEVCDENGIPRRGIKQQFLNWAAKTNQPEGDLLRADPKSIGDFILHLVESLEPPDDSGAQDNPVDSEAQGRGVRDNPDQSSDDTGSGVGQVAPGDLVACPWCDGEHEGGPENCPDATSDVEKKPGEIF